MGRNYESKRVSTGYSPRKLQAEIHRALKRFNVLVIHRRFGKTVLCVNEIIDRALRCQKKNPQYAYVAPFYSQVKRIAWQYMKEYTKEIPFVKYNEAELRIDIERPDREDRIRIYLLGAENPDALRGLYLDGCILDEYGDMVPYIFTQIVRPALSDRLGWCVFIGTPKGDNHFHDLYNFARKKPEGWFSCLYVAPETKVIDPGELAAAEREMPPEEYAQEYLCSFSAALHGSYYGKYMEVAEKDGRITSVPYDAAVPVHTFWDLGVGDTTAIWFCQIVGKEYHLIDYEEEGGKGAEQWVKVIKEKPYVYGEHTLPWDAVAREFGAGGRSRVDTIKKHGLRPIRVLQRQQREGGINAVRQILSKCWFDEDKCEWGIKALKHYQRKWDLKNKVFLKTPKHDWASNGADAFRYLAVGVRVEEIDHKLLPRMASVDYDIFAL